MEIKIDSPLRWEKKVSKIESDELSNQKSKKTCKLIGVFKKKLVCIDQYGKVTKKNI